MAGSPKSVVLTILKTVQRLTGLAFLLAMGGLLALFALQFMDAPKLDTWMVVVELRKCLDPILGEIGSWTGVVWPPAPSSWGFLPLVVALAVWGMKVGSDTAFNWAQGAVGKALLKSLKEFNATENKLRTSFRVRCGINAGEVAIYEDSRLERVAEHVIDVAGHMQKSAPPDTLWLGKEIYDVLGDQSGFFTTEQVVDGLKVHEWTPPLRKAKVPMVEATAAGRPSSRPRASPREAGPSHPSPPRRPPMTRSSALGDTKSSVSLAARRWAPSTKPATRKSAARWPSK